MRWSSGRMVCRGHPGPGLHVNDIFWIHWSQHLSTKQPKLPKWQTTRLADHPASIMPMILSISNCDSCA
ncbi:hypothetical protein TNCV_771081 [Trichonephila clavipes]|nr:hypothetical protein TNCV_771081 [Trichonephila clavipes]